MSEKRWFGISIMLAFLLAACGVQVAQPVEETQIDSPPVTAEASATLHPTVTAEPTSATPTPSDYGADGVLPPEQNGLLNRVVADLAARLQVETEIIRVINFQPVEWPDASLGCPLPGAGYAQVITPGYLIALQVQGDTYSYHTNQDGRFIQCHDGQPVLPSIPIKPGEIDDGEPWMPVDPVPTVDPGDTLADPDPVN